MYCNQIKYTDWILYRHLFWLIRNILKPIFLLDGCRVEILRKSPEINSSKLVWANNVWPVLCLNIFEYLITQIWCRTLLGKLQPVIGKLIFLSVWRILRTGPELACKHSIINYSHKACHQGIDQQANLQYKEPMKVIVHRCQYCSMKLRHSIFSFNFTKFNILVSENVSFVKSTIQNQLSFCL